VPRPTTATTVELTPASFIKLDTPRINRQTNRIEKDGRVKRKTATEMQAISRRKFATVIALTPGKRSIDPATTRPKTNAAADSIRLRQATCIGVAWNISRAISGTANTATCIPIAPHNSAPASTNTGLKDHFLLLFITKVDRHSIVPRIDYNSALPDDNGRPPNALIKTTVQGIIQEKRSAQTLDHHKHRESASLRVDLVWQMCHVRVSITFHQLNAAAYIRTSFLLDMVVVSPALCVTTHAIKPYPYPSYSQPACRLPQNV